ncbi:hypothetical protein VDGD_04282 [Verticillium dahliae]|uniref:BTB domain-containing protein n=3 Tax=Verticillium dahliae TaxID=27337 RepID=G2X1V8_VERDV|nr:uncharacterized protein VDAG_04282 [Verticillium dahliae VdLs.17]EGY22844.1 hypothetical protein VDAG_04282 [Verticillium dahliae VdLs.17]PNH34647.1 hypothetical protein BJF96_g2155 [Verticillium dahliae]PNH53279.1 hypothetical protein VD0003_g4118 [Verticillium dahliae]RBQ87248.1 hypothetical protein VDGD_04282 [Verticillium dahliae]
MSSQPNRNGEGSSAGASAERTLDDTMRAPTSTTPDVVVLEHAHNEKKAKDAPNLREDFWLSSSDGRYNSPIIPLRVGQAPDIAIFHVHKDVLLTSEYFRKALCGSFREADAQSMDLPEEDPAIFHFVVAFLYQQTFVPIQAVASVLRSETGGGKERDDGVRGFEELSSSSDSEESAASENSAARSRRLAQRRQRRQERQWEHAQQKHPETHRPGCRCPRCITPAGPPCWNCGVSRARPMPPHMMPPPPPMMPGPPVPQPHRRRRRNRHLIPTPPGSTPHAANADGPARGGARRGSNPAAAAAGDSIDAASKAQGRIHGEDMRTWFQTYALSIEVYICANKFLMNDFKAAIRRRCVDMLETAGGDAATPEVLRLCAALYAGVPESDLLLKMVFARIGFLQPLLWQRTPQETSEFLIGHPDVAALVLREAALRREEDIGGQSLPSMEVAPPLGPPPPPFGGATVVYPYARVHPGPAIWD